MGLVLLDISLEIYGILSQNGYCYNSDCNEETHKTCFGKPGPVMCERGGAKVAGARLGGKLVLSGCRGEVAVRDWDYGSLGVASAVMNAIRDCGSGTCSALIMACSIWRGVASRVGRLRGAGLSGCSGGRHVGRWSGATVGHKRGALRCC